MSQIDDLRLKQDAQERRIARLEALVNPLAKEFEEAAEAKEAQMLSSESKPEASAPEMSDPEDSQPDSEPADSKEDKLDTSEPADSKEEELKSMESFEDLPAISGEEVKQEKVKDETN